MRDESRATPTGAYIAALYIGANVLVACTTTAGDQYCYSGQEPFRQFRETTECIADAKAKLPEGQHTSKRITRLYRKRSCRRDQAVNALLHDLVARLYENGLETIYYGDLTGVLGKYWSVEANSISLHRLTSFCLQSHCLNSCVGRYSVIVSNRLFEAVRQPNCRRNQSVCESQSINFI